MNNILNMLKKELKEVFRDKKSLSMMLVIPFMIPLVIIGLSALFDSEQNKSIEEYNKIGFSYELSDVEKEIAKSLQIDYVTIDDKKIKEEYDNGNIDIYITKEENKYIINGDESIIDGYAYSLAYAYLESYKIYLQNDYLINNNINPEEVISIITIEENISETENFMADYIVNYAFLFIIMAITTSATYPATDTTAGEKERGTLETLLTFPIKSRDIIIGKFLSVSISSIITGILSLVLACVSLNIANGMFDMYKDVDLMLSGTQLIYSVVVILAISFLISGLCIAIASKCKTFKEAQSALTPIIFISCFPGMIAFMINISSSNLLSLVPFLNYSLLFNDITSGSVDMLNVILMLLSTIAIIFIILFIIIKQYKSEKVLFNN